MCMCLLSQVYGITVHYNIHMANLYAIAYIYNNTLPITHCHIHMFIVTVRVNNIWRRKCIMLYKIIT